MVKPLAEVIHMLNQAELPLQAEVYIDTWH